MGLKVPAVLATQVTSFPTHPRQTEVGRVYQAKVEGTNNNQLLIIIGSKTPTFLHWNGKRVGKYPF